MHDQHVAGRSDDRDRPEVLSGSNGSFLKRLGFTVNVVPSTIPSVYPSGAALATTSVPMLPPAPGRFSITNGCLRLSDSLSAMTRATMSDGEPAVDGTTSLIGRFG